MAIVKRVLVAIMTAAVFIMATWFIVDMSNYTIAKIGLPYYLAIIMVGLTICAYMIQREE